MSAETMEWLNTNTLRGFAAERGNAWHYMASLQGEESNHYDSAIPYDDVIRRLFHWDALSLPISYTIPEVPELITETGVTAAIAARTFTDDSRRVIVRSDNGFAMGQVSAKYVPHHPREFLLESAAEILDQSRGELGIGSAGLLKGGAVAWLQVDVPSNVVTPEGFAFRPHLIMFTSFNGTLPTTMGRCVTAVVCDNTLSAAMGELKGGQRYSLRHSSKSRGKLADMREALGIIYETGDVFSAQVAALCAQEVSAKQFSDFLDLWSPVPTEDDGRKPSALAITTAENKREALTELYRSDSRCEPWTGTAFGVLQSVNTYGQHIVQVRDGSGGKGATQGGKRYARSIMSVADGTLDKATTEARSMLASVLA